MGASYPRPACTPPQLAGGHPWQQAGSGSAWVAAPTKAARNPNDGGVPVYLAADYPFLDIFWTMLIFVMWVIWIWIVVMVFSDLFRRNDVSGWGKAAWAFFVIVLPYLGVFIYLVSQGKGMGERRVAEVRSNQEAFDGYVRNVAAGGGPAGEIAKAKELLESGAIDQAEFDQLKRKALA